MTGGSYMLNTAINIATTAHDGQFKKAGVYIFHPLSTGHAACGFVRYTLVFWCLLNGWHRHYMTKYQMRRLIMSNNEDRVAVHRKPALFAVCCLIREHRPRQSNPRLRAPCKYEPVSSMGVAKCAKTVSI